MTCPLLYRFRTVDELPEPPGKEAVRGTVIHSVLERLFDLPAQQRDVDAALSLLPAEWERLVQSQPHLPGLLFGPDDAWEAWLAAGRVSEPDQVALDGFLAGFGEFVSTYFTLEDPTRLEPAEREKSITVQLPSGLVLRGIVDRIDRAPNGAVRVVDYKTGKAPGAGWEAKALFQMRFYGVMLWQLTGTPPARLQLLYLSSGERLSIDPTEAELRATERKIGALWQAVERAGEQGRWEPNPSKLCDWCSFTALCPAWGGTPPPLPVSGPGA
jgi:putative RecB family exonuclease